MIVSDRQRHSWPGRLFLVGFFPLIGLLMAAGLACSAPAPLTTATFAPTMPKPTASPTVTRPAAQPTITSRPPTATPLPPDSGWLDLAPGLERRVLRVSNGAGGDVTETLTLLRIEPTHYHFEVLYAPDRPRTVQQWAADSGAAVTLNAGYFTPEYSAAGLIVVDGVHHGQSYGDFAGMLAVRPDKVQVRWLKDEPYKPSEPLLAAVQSFPVLIKPGGVLGFPEEDGISARRTVIAQDRVGRIVIIVCPNGTFTLHQLASYLLQTDLELDIALNLDGGTSTGLSLLVGEEPVEIPSYVPVPAVIAIKSREQ
jgi:uncharacterized protein YigE (DUF2233 family)